MMNGADQKPGAMIMQIGPYQLENLLMQQAKFVYLDLRSTGAAADHPLLRGSVRVTPSGAREFIDAQAVGPEHPVVLVCDAGDVSMQTALALETAGFINLFVVRGGAKSL